MEKNSEIILEITDVSAEGNGVGHYEGMAVFVPGTTVGDVLKVHIVKVKKNYCFGKAVEIITESDARVAVDCPVFSKCGGCVFRHIEYGFESKLKAKRVEETMRRIGGIELKAKPVLIGKPDRYRNKAQYPVDAGGRVGFFAVHSHRIIPVEDCLLQPAEFKAAANAFSHFIEKHGISVYSEETGRGLVRHFYLRKAEATGEIMAAVVINGDFLPESKQLLADLKDTLGERLKTLVLNINKEDTNVILGKENKVIYGDGYITDILCSNKIRINPLSFYQVNRTMAEVLYKKAEEYAAPEKKAVLDLYCGAGTIGLSFAKKAESIIGVEIIPEAIEDAKFNAALNGIENARFICADAAEAAIMLKKEGVKTDVVVLDPPRKGCSSGLLNTVAADFAPERIVYVSCDCATLARDCKILGEMGYAVEEYTPVDLFPRTSHVETVALLTRTVSSI